MNSMPSKVHEALEDAGIQTICKEDMYFGDDNGEDDKYPGRFYGYYLRYKGVHVAAIGLVNGVIHYEGVDSYTDNAEFVLNEVIPLDNWDEVVPNAIATTALMRMNGQFEQLNI